MNDEKKKNKLPFLGKLGKPEISDLDIIKCEKCSDEKTTNNVFIRCFKIGSYKKELIKSDYDIALFEIPIWACGNCGELLDNIKIKEDLKKHIDKSQELKREY